MALLRSNVEAAASAIREASTLQPSVGLILGTGLGGLAKEIKVEKSISYGDLPHFPPFNG